MCVPVTPSKPVIMATVDMVAVVMEAAVMSAVCRQSVTPVSQRDVLMSHISPNIQLLIMAAFNYHDCHDESAMSL